jgi:hypothetical protein
MHGGRATNRHSTLLLHDRRDDDSSARACTAPRPQQAPALSSSGGPITGL